MGWVWNRGMRQASARRYRSQTFGILLGLGIALILTLALPPASIAQSSAPTTSNQTPLERYFNVFRDAEVESRQIQLDGYDLFTIAIPAITTGNSNTTSTDAINERVRLIENTLQRFATRDFDPDTLRVSATVDEDSNLPVITVNNQYLMTVTTLDAQIHGSDPKRWANELTLILRDALVRARQERQPDSLVRQGLIAAGLLVAMGVAGQAIAHEQKKLRTYQRQIEAEIPSDPAVSAESPTSSATTTLIVQQRLTKLQQRNVNDIKRRLLNVGQLVVWGGGIFVILGLFPYTRWLQPWVLSAPLKLIGVVLATYMLNRLSAVLVDRFLEVIQENQLIHSNSPQRMSLRISTLSRMIKSGALILWVGTGLLTGLSLVGVDLLPLLAGAGLVGLAISFAAQNVIKDIINGLLILLEDQYAVGDVITVGSSSGLVENMNLRITQLRDSEGRLITIPNSAIATVQNLSKDWSRVDLTITVAYGTSPDEAFHVIQTLADEMYNEPEWKSKLLEPPQILGIDEISHTGILIRIWIKTQPLQQWAVAREFRHRLVLGMAAAGLSVGIPQQLQFVDAIDDGAIHPIDR